MSTDASRPASLWLADLTWPEVAGLLADGYATLLVMLGATEQHGPHLPLATDSLIGAALAERVAERLGGTLIAPVLPLGTSDEHLDFAGTLSLSKTTLAALIADLARSAARHGFSRMVVLSAHGGNYDAIRDGLEQARQAAPGLRVVAMTDLLDYLRLESQAARSPVSTEVPAEVAGWHAGERETAQLLWLRPGLVRMDRAAPGYVGDLKAIWPALRQAGLRPVAPNGVLGDPTAADPANGREYLERLAAALAHAVRAGL